MRARALEERLMSTRVTSAASKRAKAALITLLFPRQQSKRYSHTQLRTAYLQKVHIMHPDKQRSTSSTCDKTAHQKFIQLQNAWEAYNASARMFNKTKGDNSQDNESNFTMFGVGCSFSDSPQERTLREEFMDQACTGFLPDAILQSEDGDVPSQREQSPHQLCTNLSDDEMFTEQSNSESDYNFDKCHRSAKSSATNNLVQNVENYTRRRRRMEGGSKFAGK